MADGGFRFNFGSAVEDDVQHIAVPQQATTVTAEEVFLNGQGCVEGGTAEELGAQDSDLVPGQYEGGFKLWECAVDLCRCLCQEWDIASTLLTHKTDPCPALVGKRVLELGCGHGLPGIIPLLAGAQVHFQDYNRQVLVELTGPNAAANRQKLPPSRRAASARYFAGDWQALGRLLSREGLGGSYDIILASECIYNESTQRELLECIKQSIKPPSGCAYIAAKMYYFGVGGGTSSFKQLLKQEGMLEAKVVAMFDDGKGNKREILKLTFPELLTPYFL
eukprot:jgi/Astpho2/2333/Aster-08197